MDLNEYNPWNCFAQINKIMSQGLQRRDGVAVLIMTKTKETSRYFGFLY